MDIRNEDYRVIEKYCGSENKQKLISCIKKMESKEKIKIANTGLVSSGKSSLFNALVDKFEQERFPTGAARTTLDQDEELLKDNIYLIDTPGIDVRDADDKTAFEALLNADIIMMIHNIKMGEPTKKEIDWIKKIADEMTSDEEKKHRLIFICSWIDERDKSESYNITIQKTKKMVFDTVGTEIDFVEISTKRYITGKNKNKVNMIQKSNIPMLRELCISKASSYAYGYGNSINKKQLLRVCDDCISQLNKNYDSKKQEVKNIEDKIKKSYSLKLDRWKGILSQFEMKKNKLSRLKDELSRI